MSRFYYFLVIKSSRQRRRRAGPCCNFFGRPEVPSDPNGNALDAPNPLATAAFFGSENSRIMRQYPRQAEPSRNLEPLSHLLTQQSLTLRVASSPVAIPSTMPMVRDRSRS